MDGSACYDLDVPDESDEKARRKRAEHRRATWGAGTIVRSGTPKPSLYAGMSPTERIHRLWELTRRAWEFAGKEIVQVPRDELPGEVFDIRAERRRATE